MTTQQEQEQGFTGLTAAICRQAWSMVLPGIQVAAGNTILNRFAGCIVVLNPRSSLAQDTLFIQQVNPDDDPKYREIARSKAFISWRTGQPSARVQQEYPYLYQSGDTKWGGSTVDQGGLVVAFSGVQAEFDEMIAEWMASAIRALCRNAMRQVMVTDGSFLGR